MPNFKRFQVYRKRFKNKTTALRPLPKKRSDNNRIPNTIKTIEQLHVTAGTKP